MTRPMPTRVRLVPVTVALPVAPAFRPKRAWPAKIPSLLPPGMEPPKPPEVEVVLINELPLWINRFPVSPPTLPITSPRESRVALDCNVSVGSLLESVMNKNPSYVPGRVGSAGLSGIAGDRLLT